MGHFRVCIEANEPSPTGVRKRSRNRTWKTSTNAKTLRRSTPHSLPKLYPQPSFRIFSAEANRLFEATRGGSLFSGVWGKTGGFSRQAFQADVPQEDGTGVFAGVQVAQPTKATGGAPQAAVGGAIGAVLQIELGKVQIEDHGAVQGDFDLGAIGDHFLGVPFSSRFQMPPFGRSHAVEGAVGLPRFDVMEKRVGVIQDLKFIPDGAIGAEVQAVIWIFKDFSG
jgi:hypothetical protein